MSNLVNDYFKRFYPPDWQSAEYRYTTMLGGMNEYRGMHLESKIFPFIQCKDGLTLSVQGHYGAYSQPRDDFAKNYEQVEVGYPSARIEELMPYIDGADNDPLQSVYGYVPVSLVEKIILAHGGLKEKAA